MIPVESILLAKPTALEHHTWWAGIYRLGLAMYETDYVAKGLPLKFFNPPYDAVLTGMPIREMVDDLAFWGESVAVGRFLEPVFPPDVSLRIGANITIDEIKEALCQH